MALDYAKLRDQVASRTGIPRTVVAHVLDATLASIEAELMQQGELHLRGLFRVTTSTKRVASWGVKCAGPLRVILNVRPVRAFRVRLNSLQVG